MRSLFWGATAFIVYTYIGYPLWLWVRAQLRRLPVLRGAIEPHVSIVMVVQNEERALQGKLQNLLTLDYPAERCQIVVVSDGSADRTDEILREQSRNPRVQVVFKQGSKGKASGLNDAIAVANGEVIVFMDARQQIEAGALRVLMENFADPEVGCASGELMLGDSESGEAGKGMGLYWRVEKKIRELESASGSVVGATGALYAVRHELLVPVPEGTILDDVYIPMHVVRQGKRVVFDGRAHAWDSPDLGGGREFSRKVRTLTGNYQLTQLAPWLLSATNPLRFEFVSHKLLRLLVPFALAAVLLSSSSLPGAVYRAALGLQFLLYGFSLLALVRLNCGFVARVADASLTFVLLNAAAAVAFANFITGRKPAWSGDRRRLLPGGSF